MTRLVGRSLALILTASLTSICYAATFTVINTSASSSATGSLPWAVAQANASSGVDYITFNIPGSGVHLISVSGSLPISDQVVIDATSQHGYAGSPLIYVQQSYYFDNNSIFVLNPGSSNSTIQGLGLFLSTTAIAIQSGSSGNFIQNNWIGFYVDAYGTVELTTDFTDGIGIQVLSSSNTIRNNTISGNTNGIYVGETNGLLWSGTVYQANSISGNMLGTDPTGQKGNYYGNGIGIVLAVGALNNFVGPTNIISGNTQYGIQVGVVQSSPGDEGYNTTLANIIFQNYIGTNSNGLALPNGTGIALFNQVSGNAIGGSYGGNVISSNSAYGVDLNGAYNNFVQANIIGLDPTQAFALANGTGVMLEQQATGNLVSGNAIAGNSGNGVTIEATSVSNGINSNYLGSSFSGNSFANGAYGVAIGGDYNFIQQNSYGQNGSGNHIILPNAIGNVINP